MQVVKHRQSTWRKRYLLGSDRIKERLIGKPVLLETTLHGDFLDKLPDVRELQPVQGPTIRCYGPADVHDEKLMKELPPLSFQLDEELHTAPRPVSEVPTASSIYTKPSPRLSSSEFDPAYQVAPLFAGRSKPSDRSSSAPVLQGSDSDSTLRPPFTFKMANANGGALGIDTSFARPPWQGASGQTTQLTPIAATPATTSGPGSVSPIDDQNIADHFPYHPSDEYQTPGTGDRTTQTQILNTMSNATTPNRNGSSNHPAYTQQTTPIVSRFSWTTHATSAEAPRTIPPSTPDTQPSPGSLTSLSPSYYQRNRKYQQSPTPAGHRQYYPRTNLYSPSASSARIPPTPEATPPPIQTAASSPKTEFETTTRPPSPIMSRRRPLSAIPKNMSYGAQPNNTSPPPPASTQTMLIKRKPTPSTTTTLQSPYASPRSASAGDKQKSLPTTPTTLNSIDHITLLQAQLATLALRKHNLLKVVTSLTALFESAPGAAQDMAALTANDIVNGYAPPVVTHSRSPGPMVLDLAKRRETREKVDRLERDLAEVRREEHDLGLRLMRAQRRRDQEVPSALWVRRVTSVSDAS